jgi:hypothetical protein
MKTTIFNHSELRTRLEDLKVLVPQFPAKKAITFKGMKLNKVFENLVFMGSIVAILTPIVYIIINL